MSKLHPWFNLCKIKECFCLVSLFLVLVSVSTLRATPASAQGGNTYYISPSGNDTKSGTSESEAWATFDRAWQDIYPGDTLILLDGVYYQTLNPNKRNGEPGNPITIKAKNDGKAIIDGQNTRTPVKLGDTWPGPIGDYFVLEGIVAQNSSDNVYYIIGDHNVLRRVSGYNANTDENNHVFSFRNSEYNLLEDCIAAGTGRKMIMIYKGKHNTIRRCFADWRAWDGRDWHDCWPWGDGIEIYIGKHNIIENSIAYGHTPTWAISLLANSTGGYAIGNKILGTMAIRGGMKEDGTPMVWGNTRPQPTEHTCIRKLETWPSQRAGFYVHNTGEIRDNLLQDIFSWGNAGLGLSFHTGNSHPGTGSNHINRATILNNGLDNPDGPYPGKYGGVDTDVLQTELDRFDSITNSYIDKIFVDWPDYPNGERNLASMQGEGARLTHRYVDGVLTDEPLWPWPMAGRIQAELGILMSEIESIVLNGGKAFAVEPQPSFQKINPGQTIIVTLNIEPTNGFTETVELDVSSPSSDLIVTSSANSKSPPGQVTITLEEKNSPSFTGRVWYKVPIIATSSSITRTATINLLVNGMQAFVPMIIIGPN